MDLTLQIMPIDPSFGVSDAAKDLIHCMIVADPNRRATLEQIMAHPWFLQNLPPNLLGLNSYYFGRAPNPTEVRRNVFCLFGVLR